MMGTVMNVCKRATGQNEASEEKFNEIDEIQRKRALNAARIKRYRDKMQGIKKQAYLAKQREYQARYRRKKITREIVETVSKI